MKKNRIFNDVLNECIERMLKGVSVETCLKSFPEYAARLEPILRTAAETRKAAAIKPRPEFRQQAGYEFQTAIREMGPAKRGFPRWHLRWVAAVSALMVIMLAGTGTVAAANNSLPDQPLYTVKMVTEDMRLTLTTSALGKAELYAEFTNKRVDEIVKMADKGNVEQVEKVTERLNEHLGAIANLPLPANDADAAVEETPAAVTAQAAGTQAVAPDYPRPTLTLEPAPEEPASAAPAATHTPAPTTAVKPSTPTPTPAQTVKPTPTPTPNTGVKVTPVPAPSASVNASSYKATPRPEIKAAPAPAPSVSNISDKDKKQDDLKISVSQQAEKNNQKLEEVLKRVPDNMKPSLKKAIESAGKGYDEALKNIDRRR